MTTMTEPSHATPHRLRETTADVIDEDIVLSPAYNNLLADVRSLRESLRIAETELRIMVASSPKKQRPKSATRNRITSPSIRRRPASATTRSSPAISVATTSNNNDAAATSAVSGRVSAIELRIQKAHQELLHLQKQPGYKASSIGYQPSNAAKIAMNNANVTIASSTSFQKSKLSNTTTRATGTTTISGSNGSAIETNSHKFDSVYQLCDDALEFASSLKFGQHMESLDTESMSPLKLSSSGLHSGSHSGSSSLPSPSSGPMSSILEEKNMNSSDLINDADLSSITNSTSWKDEAREGARKEIERKILKAERRNKKQKEDAIRKELNEELKNQAIKHEAEQMYQNEKELEMANKLLTLEKKMNETAEMISSIKPVRHKVKEEEKEKLIKKKNFKRKKKTDKMTNLEKLKVSNNTITPSKLVVKDPEERYRRYAGAVSLQTQWRAKQARQFYIQKKEYHNKLKREEELRKIQLQEENERKAKLHQKNLRQKKVQHATLIQSKYRSHLARRSLNVQHDAAIDLQRVVRGRQHRRKLRMNIAQQEYAIKIQSSWRRKSECDTIKNIKRKNSELKAATIMQAHTRRYNLKNELSKRRYQKEQEEIKRRLLMATKIQSTYRGHLKRRLLTLYFVAAIRIQNFYKSLKAKRAWLKLRLDVPTILRAEKLWGMDMTGRTDTSYRKVNNLLASMIEKATDKDGNNALMLASRAGSIRLVKLCIGAGYLPSDTNTSDHQTALHMAASSGGDRSLIGQLLITAGSDITATDSLGRTVCHIAASSGDHKLLQLLCDKGAPLEVTDKISGGRTPLHCASYFNHAECARVLLFAGANVNVKSSTGQTTPLHTAAARGAKHVVHLLCECEADINAADLGGNTPLHLSCAAGHTETVKTLLTFACQTDPKNRSGDTPGHFAASMGHEDCFHLLMVSVMSVFLSVCFSYFYILLIVVVATVAIDFFFLLF